MDKRISVEELSDEALLSHVGAYVVRNSTGQDGTVRGGYTGADTAQFPEDAVTLLRELYRRELESRKDGWFRIRYGYRENRTEIN